MSVTTYCIALSLTEIRFGGNEFCLAIDASCMMIYVCTKRGDVQESCSDDAESG